MLLLLPLATYWNTTFHDFGLRDEYANLREAHEEPGKIIQFTASHARPVYGWLLQHSFERIDEIAGLEWLRLAGAAGLGLAAAALFGVLLRLGWRWPAAGFAAAMTVLAPAGPPPGRIRWPRCWRSAGLRWPMQTVRVPRGCSGPARCCSLPPAL